MALKLSRLWQPTRAMFWMMLLFNLLSSACAYVLRAWPLNTAGVVLVGVVGLMNVVCGLLAAWALLREEPPPPPSPPPASPPSPSSPSQG